MDVEKAFVVQVFDLYQPRTYDTLVSFTLGELAEELGERERTRSAFTGERHFWRHTARPSAK